MNAHKGLFRRNEAALVRERFVRTRSSGAFLILLLLAILNPRAIAAPTDLVAWQYHVSVDRSLDKQGKLPEPGRLFFWMPPKCQTLRGLFILGQLGIEGELVVSPEIRRACVENDLGIAYFEPHLSGVFHFWEAGNTDGARMLKALDDLAKRAGHPEIRRVPWIVAGHSTAGIFCRNVAYWKPERVAGVVHIKSGNFWQKEHLPPDGSLKGVPLMAINGQFESFGPAEGIQPELGRETQWTYVLRNLQQFRRTDPEHLMSLWVHHGDDHFQGAPELERYVALFLRKCAQYRLPKALPAGDAPAPCLTVKAEQGWLTDADLYAPKHAPAPHGQYTGDKAAALWHFDREIAEATAAWHKNLGRHQCLENPTATFLDEGDGWKIKVRSTWLDRMPEKFGGRVGNQEVGHSSAPFVFRSKLNEPVMPVGADTFQLLRLPTGRKPGVNLAAFHPGDEQFRSTVRWGALAIPQVKGETQTIDFAPVGDIKASDAPRALTATASSKLPVHLEVEFGPVLIKDGRLVVAELPTNPQFPIECKVTAFQIGRRTAPAIAPAPPVSQLFKVMGR